MSLFASNIGSEHLVRLSGSQAAAGIGVGAFELNVSLVCFLFIFLTNFYVCCSYLCIFVSCIFNFNLASYFF